MSATVYTILEFYTGNLIQKIKVLKLLVLHVATWLKCNNGILTTTHHTITNFIIDNCYNSKRIFTVSAKFRAFVSHIRNR